MPQRIRQVLLTQYIGAIVTGLVAAQGIGALISAFVMPVGQYFQARALSDIYRSKADVVWGMGLGSLTSAILHFAVAYILLRWLYLKPEKASKPTSERAAESL